MDESDYQGCTSDPHFSDHQAEKFQFSTTVTKEESQLTTKVVMNSTNIEKFERELKNIRWEALTTNDASISYTNFHENLQKCFELSFPRMVKERTPKRKMARTSEESQALKKALGAAESVHYVQRSAASGELISILKRHLRESYTRDKRNKMQNLCLTQTINPNLFGHYDSSILTPDSLNSFFS
ncbi:hypothetical protein HHI36_013669 [Cryptolaemus montrouzieri]|uniref:Uncharacterized protein n=1 Tax=Cryptolaemus montrouzieri TaxID=559131 RepID=A0ABD2NI51_9CUCU